MRWIKILSNVYANPKLRSCTPKSFRAWIFSLTYCSDQQTDGIVPASAFALCGLTSKIIRELEEKNLIIVEEKSEKCSSDVLQKSEKKSEKIHQIKLNNYLKYQQSKEEIRAKKSYFQERSRDEEGRFRKKELRPCDGPSISPTKEKRKEKKEEDTNAEASSRQQQLKKVFNSEPTLLTFYRVEDFPELTRLAKTISKALGLPGRSYQKMDRTMQSMAGLLVSFNEQDLQKAISRISADDFAKNLKSASSVTPNVVERLLSKETGGRLDVEDNY